MADMQEFVEFASVGDAEIIEGKYHDDGWLSPRVQLTLKPSKTGPLTVAVWNPDLNRNYYRNEVLIRLETGREDVRRPLTLSFAEMGSASVDVKKGTPVTVTVESSSVMQPDDLDQRLRGVKLARMEIGS